MELEFTNDDGEGTGRRLYRQLKSGNSHLTKRKTGDAEIFTIKKQRWVGYWIEQPHPVMLVIGTFSEDDERAIGKDKLEFAEVPGAVGGGAGRAGEDRGRRRDQKAGGVTVPPQSGFTRGR